MLDFSLRTAARKKQLEILRKERSSENKDAQHRNNSDGNRCNLVR